MKTSQIQLPPDGDWRSTLARIRGGTQGRVILLWPERGEPRAPRLVLQLAARRCQRLRVPLALVTSKPDIRAMADEFGIPTFGNARQARKESWDLPPKVSMPKPALTMEGIYLRIMAEERRAKFAGLE
ncbi:MAG: hypothetical protein KJZ53_10430 [Anaerolineales bacterium]|nr:hypothetical protein [Anaerolineales bacterium]